MKNEEKNKDSKPKRSGLRTFLPYKEPNSPLTQMEQEMLQDHRPMKNDENNKGSKPKKSGLRTRLPYTQPNSTLTPMEQEMLQDVRHKSKK